ncbi:hypothetical protein [Halopiger djelfimassiliensis]|uniref:hypothetical protein n=1 Tax=Halopiger djelfimassiliensis TaxID=1293047 RepID=UPI000677F3C9|nr:hypothetical protein [Halopiger djelfimassiliensis]
MNRTLAITLTVAMIGSLAFMGLAGTAAAHEGPEPAEPVTVEEDVTNLVQSSTADVTQAQEVNQQNFGEQSAQQDADQNSTGIGGDPIINVGITDGTDGSLTIDIGTTGDQTIEQNVNQEMSQSNQNSQVGEATAFNVLG